MDKVTLRRLPFDVEAVQITEENMEEVARWCGGKVRRYPNKSFIKLFDTKAPLRSQGEPNDWVVLKDGRFRIYSDIALKGSFYIPTEEAAQNVFDVASGQTVLTIEDGEITHRSAVTGQYVTERFAEDNPDTTVQEKN